MTQCTFQFICGKEWDQLDATLIPQARFCGECRRSVFMVKKEHEFHLASALGRCVGIAGDNDFIGVIGEPSGTGGLSWMEEDGFFQDVFISLNTVLTKDRLAQLRLFYPRLFDDAENERKLCAGVRVNVGSLGKGERAALRSELEVIAPELRASSEA